MTRATRRSHNRNGALWRHLKEILPHPKQLGLLREHVERLLHFLQRADHVLRVAVLVGRLAVKQRPEDLVALVGQQLHNPFKLRRHPRIVLRTSASWMRIGWMSELLQTRGAWLICWGPWSMRPSERSQRHHSCHVISGMKPCRHQRAMPSISWCHRNWAREHRPPIHREGTRCDHNCFVHK